MAITKEKKSAILERLDDIFANTASVVFVNFHGLGHGDENEMRQTLHKEGVGYYVAKKTLIRRSLEKRGYTGELPELNGEVAVLYQSRQGEAEAGGEDQVAPAREIYEFTKKHKDNLAILGGVFEGTYMDQAAMMDIATIPPLQVLYGQIANVINSPLQGLVIALNGVAEKKT